MDRTHVRGQQRIEDLEVCVRYTRDLLRRI
jgi:hypothetical protein